MKVLVDCDGPLADFVGGLCFALQEEGRHATPEGMRHWDLRQCLDGETMALADAIIRTPGFCRDLRRAAGATWFMNRLRGLGHELFCLTAPCVGAPDWYRERLQWLAANQMVERRNVIFAAGKHKRMVAGDVLIEDHPTTCAQWCDANPKGIAILVDRPWNQPSALEYVPHVHTYRARTAADIVRLVQEASR